MKNLIASLLLVTSIMAYGQKEGKPRQQMQDFTPEQQAILKTKKMALHLDLNQNQQDQLLALNRKWAKEKEAKKAELKALNKEEMTSDQKFKHMNAMLDTQIAHQNEMKKLLNEEQYKVWKKSRDKKSHMLKGRKEQYAKKMRMHQR
ncbi:hypothetical protein LCM02_14815 [Lutimonas saemankumensis]|uniref:hypothetical protein n=1 Tax=Lutimonas saemankumensis TaxID=483016 RepID=UPI001CD4B764|nr:hypothetical protein [Lutimonas saemankumensis]MCA0933730.1 hypothetical protein [Lutimonas saemankumensis]